MNLKLKRLIASLIISIILLSFITTPCLAISNTPSTLAVNNINAYESAIGSGDIIFLIDYTIDYAVTPTEPVSTTYIIRLFDATNVEIASTVPYVYFDNGYARGIASLYFDATEAASLTWGAGYYVRIDGNPSAAWTGAPIPTSPINNTIYWQTVPTTVTVTRNIISNYILNYAQILQYDWASVSYVLYNGGMLLTTQGAAYFTAVIPSLNVIASGILSTYNPEPELLDRTWGNSWQTQIDAMINGTIFDLSALGTLFNVSGRMVTGILWFALTIFVIIIASRVMKSYKPAMLISIPMIVCGVLIGWIPVILGVGLGFICAVMSIYVITYEKSST